MPERKVIRWTFCEAVNNETFEKRPVLFKVKKGEDFNRKNTLSILRIEI